jgi:hypothetical protein
LRGLLLWRETLVKGFVKTRTRDSSRESPCHGSATPPPPIPAVPTPATPEPHSRGGRFAGELKQMTVRRRQPESEAVESPWFRPGQPRSILASRSALCATGPQPDTYRSRAAAEWCATTATHLIDGWRPERVRAAAPSPTCPRATLERLV